MKMARVLDISFPLFTLFYLVFFSQVLTFSRVQNTDKNLFFRFSIASSDYVILFHQCLSFLSLSSPLFCLLFSSFFLTQVFIFVSTLFFAVFPLLFPFPIPPLPLPSRLPFSFFTFLLFTLLSIFATKFLHFQMFQQIPNKLKFIFLFRKILKNVKNGTRKKKKKKGRVRRENLLEGREKSKFCYNWIYIIDVFSVLVNGFFACSPSIQVQFFKTYFSSPKLLPKNLTFFLSFYFRLFYLSFFLSFFEFFFLFFLIPPVLYIFISVPAYLRKV